MVPWATPSEQSSERKSRGTSDHHPATEENGALSERVNAGESKGTKTAVFRVYILRCSDGTLYIGSTDKLDARVKTHNDGRGARYTAARRPVTLVYSEESGSRSAAEVRERQVKRWTNAKKEALVAGNLAHVHRLARRRT
jgi:predicted GIY-YIG superfamily endonuclease